MTMEGAFRSPERVERVRNDSGTSVIEFVFVVPIAMFVIMLAVQFASWSHGEEVVQLAASSGDRVARAYGSTSAAGVAQARSVLQGPGSNVSGAKVTVTEMPGDFEKISITGQVTTVIPGLKLWVSATVIGPRQEFRSTE